MSKYPNHRLLLAFFLGLCLVVGSMTGCPSANTDNAQTSPIKSANWETISAPSGVEFCDRARVPGGWIVHTTGTREAAMTFVPDPDHKWLNDDVEGSR